MLSVSLCRIKERRGVEMFEVFGNEIRNWSTHLQCCCSTTYRPIVPMNSQACEILLFPQKKLARKIPRTLRARPISFVPERRSVLLPNSLLGGDAVEFNFSEGGIRIRTFRTLNIRS
jgi:hypothetical protein